MYDRLPLLVLHSYFDVALYHLNLDTDEWFVGVKNIYRIAMRNKVVSGRSRPHHHAYRYWILVLQLCAHSFLRASPAYRVKNRNLGGGGGAIDFFKKK